ncbi:jg27372, partial [Pararge aegeria aegeria]
PQPGLRNFPCGSSSVGQSFLEGRLENASNRGSVYHQKSQSLLSGHVVGPSTSQGSGYNFRSMEMWGWDQNLLNWNFDQINLLQSSWRPSTRKTYKVAWSRWLKWAEKHGINPTNPDGSALARFLADLFLIDKLSYNTILLHKSVIATLCNANSSGILGSHTLVKHVLKSIALKQPVASRPSTWNIDDLLSYLTNRKIDSNNTFITSRHTAALLLLCSGRRIHDLTLFRVDSDHLIISNDYVILWPVFGSKTDSATYRQSGWKLLKNSENVNLDPVYWIHRTIDILKDRRKSATCNNLFMNIRGQAKPASRAVIAGWIRSLLLEANIIATPGSFRSAVASKNWSQDLPIDNILARGNWRAEGTFRKFYKRQVRPAVAKSDSIVNLFDPIN